MNGTVSLEKLYKKYGNRVEFATVYVREAHGKDQWWMGEGPVITWMIKNYSPNAALDEFDPRTMDDRRAVAARMIKKIDYKIPLYVDGMHDRVSKLYAGKPTRLYLVGADGRVIYAAGTGPYDFFPRKLEKAIELYLKYRDEGKAIDEINPTLFLSDGKYHGPSK
ncbi:MAG: hypothetical protein GY754_39090 [bacterium]|nr:hypothetical protein [bacterium]